MVLQNPIDIEENKYTVRNSEEKDALDPDTNQSLEQDVNLQAKL